MLQIFPICFSIFLPWFGMLRRGYMELRGLLTVRVRIAEDRWSEDVFTDQFRARDTPRCLALVLVRWFTAKRKGSEYHTKRFYQDIRLGESKERRTRSSREKFSRNEAMTGERGEEAAGTGVDTFRDTMGRTRCAFRLGAGKNSTLPGVNRYGVENRPLDAQFIKFRCGSIAGPRELSPSFCLASAQLNSTSARSFHKSHPAPSTRAFSRV